MTVWLFVLALVAAACGGGSGTASGGNRRGFEPPATNRAQPRLSPKGVRGPTIQPPPAPAVHQSGAGTNDDPFVAPCDPNPDGDGNCVVSSFDEHFLDGTGSGADQDTDAYKCPPTAPFMVAKNYAPFGTALMAGVEIRQDHTPWYIGVVIIADYGLRSPPTDQNGTLYFVGPGHDGGLTHAHNWDIFAQHAFQVVLHCTADLSRGSCVQGTGGCSGPPSLGSKPASRQSPKSS